MITRCGNPRCNAPHACDGRKTIVFCDSDCLTVYVASVIVETSEKALPILMPGTAAFAILADVASGR